MATAANVSRDLGAALMSLMDSPPPMEHIAATALIGALLILLLTGRLVSTVTSVLSWTLTTVHSVLLALFTGLNVMWAGYVVLITCVTQEIDYSAKDWVYFNGPTALAMVALPSAIYLNVVRWKKDKVRRRGGTAGTARGPLQTRARRAARP